MELKCKECGCVKSKVIRTSRTSEGLVYRERKCKECNTTYYTVEVLEGINIQDFINYLKKKSIKNVVNCYI